MKKINYMVLACSLLLCSGCNFNLEKDEYEFSSDIVETTGIKLRQNRSVGDTITYTYELVPSSAVDDLEISVAWTDSNVNLSIGSYFDYSISHVNKTFSITKKLDFSHQATVRLQSENFVGVYATVTVDLKQKFLGTLKSSGSRDVQFDLSNWDLSVEDILPNYMEYSSVYTIALTSLEKQNIRDSFIDDESILTSFTGVQRSIVTFDSGDDGFSELEVYQSSSNINLDFSSAHQIYDEGTLSTQFRLMGYAHDCWHVDGNNDPLEILAAQDVADLFMQDLSAEGHPDYPLDPDDSYWYGDFVNCISSHSDWYTHFRFTGLLCRYDIKYLDPNNTVQNYETIYETLNMVISVPNSYFVPNQLNAQSGSMVF